MSISNRSFHLLLRLEIRTPDLHTHRHHTHNPPPPSPPRWLVNEDEKMIQIARWIFLKSEGHETKNHVLPGIYCSNQTESEIGLSAENVPKIVGIVTQALTKKFFINTSKNGSSNRNLTDIRENFHMMNWKNTWINLATTYFLRLIQVSTTNRTLSSNWHISCLELNRWNTKWTNKKIINSQKYESHYHNTPKSQRITKYKGENPQNTIKSYSHTEKELSN